MARIVGLVVFTGLLAVSQFGCSLCGRKPAEGEEKPAVEKAEKAEEGKAAEKPAEKKAAKKAPAKK